MDTHTLVHVILMQLLMHTHIFIGCVSNISFDKMYFSHHNPYCKHKQVQLTDEWMSFSHMNIRNIQVPL